MIKELKNHLIVLKFNRIWVEGEDAFKIGTWLIRFFCLVSLFIAMCGMIIEIYFARENVITVTYCISLIGATGPNYAKCYCMIKWSPVLKNILKNLESELASKYEIDEEEKRYIVNAEKIIRNYFRKYVLITGTGCGGLVLIPLMKKIVILLKLIPESPIGTPEPTWMPFDIEDNYHYYLVCVLQGYHLYSIWALWAGSDVLFGGITFHLCGHLSIISKRLNVWISSRAIKCETLKGRKADLRKIVSYHAEVLNLCKDLNKSVNLYHLHQLFFVSIIICSCGMQIMKSRKEEATQAFVMLILLCCMLASWLAVCFIGTTIITESPKEDITRALMMLLLLSCILASWWVVCFFGSEISNKCQIVGQSVYLSKWINLSSKERKNIHFIISRCQKPVHLTSEKFVKISLSTFLDTAKMSYSLSAILREAYD